MKKLLLFICLIALFTSCNKKHYKERVQCYKSHSLDSSGNDIWLYYYLFSMNNNSTYYYYSSTSPVASFGGVEWQTSTTNPVSNLQTEEMPVEEVATEQLPMEVQQEMDTNPENFEGMTQDEMGDYEGGGNESAPDNSADGGNSDSGSGGGDSGGGSDGGGDGGGGE